MKWWVLVCSLCVVASAEGQIVRKGVLRAADRELIAALGGSEAERFLVEARAPSGAVTRLVGRIEVSGDTLEERVDDLLTRAGPLFDVRPGLVAFGPPRVLRNHPSGEPWQVRLAQLVHGHEVVGHGLKLEFDAHGDVRLVHGIVSEAAAALAAPRLDDARVIDAAAARLVADGRAAASWRTQPSIVARLIDPLARGLRPFARVGVVSGPGYTPLAVDVDVLDGTVLASFEDRTHFGTGTFKFNGQLGPFKTGKGKGVVYGSFKHAAQGKPSLRPLKELGFETAVPVLAEDNSLFGRFSWVLDETPPDGELFTINGSAHKFLGFPSDVIAADADLFDAANCYFHITEFALAMTKLAGSTLPTDFAMPTIVNTPFEPFNAFFSPQDPGLGTGPGFMVFGDNKFHTGFLADDLARDPSVMCHEYLHAIAAFSGLGFGTPPLNVPNRAVNEAIADYFAASFFKDPRIGFPIAQIGSADLLLTMGLTATGGLRNLAAPKTMFDHLLEITVDGIPEEHAAGHLFAATLWQVRERIGQKAADTLIFDSMFNWPQSLAELGYVEFGAGNAVEAYRDYFEACLFQLTVDAFQTRGKSGGLKVLGAAMRNGCIGLVELGTGAVLDLSTGGSFTIDSSFLGTSEGHLVGLAVNSGQTLDITVVGNKKANTKVDFGFASTTGLSFPKPAIVKGNSVKLPGIQVNQGNVYLLVILNEGLGSFADAPYKLKVKAK